MADGDNDDTRLSERSVTDTADGDEEDTRLLERRVTDTADGDDEDTSVSDTADGDDEEVKGSEMDVAWAAWDGHVQALRGRAKRPRGGVEPPIPAEGKIPDPIVAEDMERGFSIPSSMLPDTTGVYRWLPIFRGSIRLMLLVQSFTRVRNAEILDLEMRLLFGNRLLEGKRAREGIEVIVDDGEGARGKGKGFWGRLGFGGVHGSEGASEPKERVDESLFRALWDYMREQTDHPRRKNREERYEETKWMTSLEKVKSVFEEWHSSTDRGQGTIGRSRAIVQEFHDLLEKFVDINVAFWGARPGESTTRRCAEEWVQRANKVDRPGIPWSRIDGLREGLARGVEHMQNLCQSLHARHDMDTIARMRELLEESMEDDEKPLQFCMFLARLNAGLQTMRHDLEAVQELSSRLTLEYVDELREVRLLFRQDLEGPETRRIPAYKGGARVPRHCI